MAARSLLAVVLLALGCAPLPPVEPYVQRAKRPAPPTSYAKLPPQRAVLPTPARRDYTLDEQEVGEAAAVQPDMPPPDLVTEDESELSLAPQIKAAKAPNVAAALRMVDESRVQISRQQYRPALERLQRAVSIDPSSFYGYYYLAKAHYATQDYSQAVAFANRATALGAHADRAWLARAYTLQGEIFEKVGRFPEARRAYQRAVDADPTNLAAYVGKARLTPKEAPTPPVHEDPWN